MDEREVFLAVVEAQGFSAAAKRINSTPAAVSRRIKALEQRLGVRLLQRTTRKIRLTEQGEQYYREISKLLGELNQLELELSEATNQPMGELRITAPMTFAQRRLTPMVTSFALKYPGLRVSLMLEDRESDIIAEGLDVAIRIAYPNDSSLVGRAIAPIPRSICASPEYIKRKGVPAVSSDLGSHDCLHYNLISERQEWFFPGSDNVVINGKFCSNNGEVLAQAAIDGLGIAYLPDFIVEQALADGRLVRLLENIEHYPLTLYAKYPSRKHLPLKTRLFIDFVIKHLGESQE